MKMPLARKGAALVLTLLVSGCGFHLQGRAEYPPAFAAVFLEIPDPNSDLARQLRRSLEAAAVPLVAEAGDATAVLELASENYGSRVKSVSAQNRPTELEVYYIAEYLVRAGNRTLVPRQRITRTRIFTYNERDILGKAHEEELLRGALAREIAGVITRRLADIEA
jgi:LPS-assembly lipoprotein